MEVIKINEIERAVTALKNGGLIVYPTETVYGLGVDATNERALSKLWEFKGERGDKSVLVAVSDIEMAEKYVTFSSLGKKIAQKYWPGAVAIVAVSKYLVVKKAQGGANTLGLRMPDNKMILDIISAFGKPITSTSANVSGTPTARSLEEFLKTLSEEKLKLIDLFIDVGELPSRLPSTIVDTTGEKIKILRQGDVVVEV